MSLWIFSAKTSPSAPPKTVKSWLKTNTLRPSIVPHPVMTPSVYGRSSRPAAWARCRASRSSSWNEPGSSRYSTRSRASSLPLACWRSTARGGAGVVGLLLALAQIVELGLHRVVRHDRPRLRAADQHGPPGRAVRPRRLARQLEDDLHPERARPGVPGCDRAAAALVGAPGAARRVRHRRGELVGRPSRSSIDLPDRDAGGLGQLVGLRPWPAPRPARGPRPRAPLVSSIENDTPPRRMSSPTALVGGVDDRPGLVDRRGSTAFTRVAWRCSRRRALPSLSVARPQRQCRSW